MANDTIVHEDVESILLDIIDFCKVLQNKRFLVVGGKGFIGTYICKTLLALNKKFSDPITISVMDNLITAKDHDRYDDTNIEFIEADISKKLSIKGDVDYIIHAASIASPTFYRKYPLKTIDVNYQGTRNILELAKEKRSKAVLYLSSSEIYGDPSIVPTPETYLGYVSCIGPRACYDESKRLAETICAIYHQQLGMPVKIARPFNVYGPYLNLNDGRVIPDFINNAMKKSEIIIHSDGTPTRSFCYITDAIRAIFRILLLAPDGCILNLGNDEEISMLDVAKKIQKIMGRSINLKFEKSSDPNYIKDNPQRRCPDLSNIKSIVGYYPEIGLDEGLSRILQWYQVVK